MTSDWTPFNLPPETRVGRVALRTVSLDRVVLFYRRLGFDVVRESREAWLVPADGAELVVLTEDPSAPERSPNATGLFHFAVRVPTRQALTDAFARINDTDLTLTGASNHLVSEGLYLRDPDGNGVEIYRDMPCEEWPRTDSGRIDIGSVPLDLDALAAEPTESERFPRDTDIGHVHLELVDLDRAREFYVDRVGFGLQAPDHRDEALFVAADDYHHHLELNGWNGRTRPAGDTRGLDWYKLVVPDEGALERLERWLDAFRVSDTLVVTDPDGIELHVRVEQ